VALASYTQLHSLLDGCGETPQRGKKDYGCGEKGRANKKGVGRESALMRPRVRSGTRALSIAETLSYFKTYLPPRCVSTYVRKTTTVAVICTKTSCADDGITYLFALPPQLPSPRSLPHGRDFRPGPVALKPRHHWLFEVGRAQSGRTMARTGLRMLPTSP